LGTATAGGAGDALAAGFLLSAGSSAEHSSKPEFFPEDGTLAELLAFHALAHLEVSGLLAGFGTDLAGSERIRRLAADAGLGLREALDAELQELFDLAGASAGEWQPAQLVPMLFPWLQGDARLESASADARRNQRDAWRTVEAGTSLIDSEQIGQAMLARVLAVGRLLEQARGTAPGLTVNEGVLGLALLQQVMAMEETLFRSLFMDGISLGELTKPKLYDPQADPRWLPRSIRVILAPEESRLPAAYMPEDRVSDLAALASLLRAASELALLADEANPNPTLRAVFENELFKREPTGGPTTPPDPNFLTDVQPILLANCSGCHTGPSPQSFFSIETYERTIEGGFWIKPAVVPGDRFAGSLWPILNGPIPAPGNPFSINQMPFNRPKLGTAEIDLIGEWIDTGAAKEPPPPPEPPLTGLDLARVLYLNLRHLHALPETGAALHHRYLKDDLGESPRVEHSYVSDARSTGMALSALASYVAVDPANQDARVVLESVALIAKGIFMDAVGLVAQDFDMQSLLSSKEKDLSAQAAMTSGLLAAARTTGSGELADAGLLAGEALLREFFDGRSFSESEADAARLSPDQTALILDALREMVASGRMQDAASIHDAFLRFMLPALVFSEFEGQGEVIADGIPDTDGDGIPEPALAKDGQSLAPLLAGLVQQGLDSGLPKADGAITWSRHILPLFRERCASCHLDGAVRGDYRLDSPGLAAMAGESGLDNLIIPGDPDGSFLFRKLADRNPPIGDQMPLALPPLDPRGLALVRQWILEGASAR
jgi:hypothetical protein